MNLFTQLSIDHPHPHQLRIRRDQGLFFTLFMLVYLGFVVGINGLFIVMALDVESPQKLTCRSQQQRVNCQYATTGPLNRKTIQIRDVRSAIASNKPNGETIVLTTSNRWEALQATNNNTQNIRRINQGLAQLRQHDQVWRLELRPPAGMGLGVLLFFSSIGMLFLLVGLVALFTECSADFVLDADRNTITITKLGLLRSQPAAFDKLDQADSQPFGYLGVLSDKFGIYLRDNDSWGHNIVRLVFKTRRPISLTQTWRLGEAARLVDSINAFITAHRP